LNNHFIYQPGITILFNAIAPMSTSIVITTITSITYAHFYITRQRYLFNVPR